MRDFANLQGSDSLKSVPGQAGIALLAGIVLALLGPFTTSQRDLFTRLGYWTALIAAWLALSFVVAWALSRYTGLPTLPRWLQVLLSATIVALPMSMIAGFATHILIGWQPSPAEMLEMYGQTLMIGLIVEAVKMAVALSHTALPLAVADQGPALTASRDNASSVAVAPTPSRLLDRLAPHGRDGVVCLQMEDHYVRVHTTTGSSLVLMRFADAMNEVDGIDGLRVHRSWWVAINAIDRLRRVGRTAQIELCNGVFVPVSQPYLAAALATVEKVGGMTQ